MSWTKGNSTYDDLAKAAANGSIVFGGKGRSDLQWHFRKVSESDALRQICAFIEDWTDKGKDIGQFQERGLEWKNGQCRLQFCSDLYLKIEDKSTRFEVCSCHPNGV